MEIRMGQSSDASDLLPLVSELGYPTTKPKLIEKLDTFLTREGYGLAVAIVDTKVIGFIAWSSAELFVSDLKRYRIEGLLVSEAFTGQGIGKQLISFFESQLSAHCSHLIEVTSGRRRESTGAHEFYHELGYQNDPHTGKLYLRKMIINP